DWYGKWVYSHMNLDDGIFLPLPWEPLQVLFPDKSWSHSSDVTEQRWCILIGTLEQVEMAMHHCIILIPRVSGGYESQLLWNMLECLLWVTKE
ncbi:hypothetical protein NPIL_24871, partial [Nephila pilipes]